MLKELYEKFNILIDEQAVALRVMPYIERTFLGEDITAPKGVEINFDYYMIIANDWEMKRLCGSPLCG